MCWRIERKGSGQVYGSLWQMKQLCVQTAAHVMRNMLLSHAKAYKAIKALPGVVTLFKDSGGSCLSYLAGSRHACIVSSGVTPTIGLHS